MSKTTKNQARALALLLSFSATMSPVNRSQAQEPAADTTQSLDSEMDSTSQEQNAHILPAPAADTSASSSSVDGNPNLDFEKRVFNIFHAAKPVSDAQWSEMIGSRREDLYVVQPGDTLWDISTTMFGDGFYWSKLWAENGKLENPHQITKGQGIRFLAGNEDAAPKVDVVSKEQAEQITLNLQTTLDGRAPMYREQALKEISADELASGDIEIDELIPKPTIPAGKNSRPVLKNLPASFVANKVPDDQQYDSTGLIVGKRKSLTEPADVTPGFYLADQALSSVGTVVEIEAGEKVASVGQSIFIKSSAGLTPGQKLSVVSPQGKLKDKVRGEVGPIVEVGGRIEVTSVVDEKRGLYRALVLNDVNPIRLDALVIESALPKTNFDRVGTRTDQDVRVLGGEFDDKRTLMGDSSVVYLDGGAKAGMNVGDILPVQSVRSAHREDSVVAGFRKSVGLVKIFEVHPTVASAIIIETGEEVRPGDRTGGGLPGSAPSSYHSQSIDEGDQTAMAPSEDSGAASSAPESSAAPAQDAAPQEDAPSEELEM